MASSLEEERMNSGDRHAKLRATSGESSASMTQSRNHATAVDTKPGPPNQPSLKDNAVDNSATGTFAANPADPEVGLPAGAIGPGPKEDCCGEPDLTLHMPGDGKNNSSALGGERNNGGAVADHRTAGRWGWQGGRHLLRIDMRRISGYILEGIVFLVLSGMFVAGTGAFILMIGTSALNAAGHEGYFGGADAAMVGAVGGSFGGLLLYLWIILDEDKVSWCAPTAISTLGGMLSGPIGSSILGGRLDVLHATRAGAVGSAILVLTELILAFWWR